MTRLKQVVFVFIKFKYRLKPYIFYNLINNLAVYENRMLLNKLGWFIQGDRGIKRPTNTHLTRTTCANKSDRTSVNIFIIKLDEITQLSRRSCDFCDVTVVFPLKYRKRELPHTGQMRETTVVLGMLLR